jgi:hypothetical protein
MLGGDADFCSHIKNVNTLILYLDPDQVKIVYLHNNYRNMSYSYTKQEIISVWKMATTAQGYNPDFVRRDRCGALIQLNQHGNRQSDYGWEIDHVKPTAKGGSHTYQNVQPLHWHNNSSKGDGELTCTVSST